MADKKRARARSRRKGPTPRSTTKAADRPIHPSTVRTTTGKRPVDRTPSAGAPPVASSRFTPKIKARGPFRPTWHKAVGVMLVLAGLGIFVLNDLAWFDINLIPGGHNELWAMAAFGTAFASTWWFGWFDRTPKPPSRRL